MVRPFRRPVAPVPVHIRYIGNPVRGAGEILILPPRGLPARIDSRRWRGWRRGWWRRRHRWHGGCTPCGIRQLLKDPAGEAIGALHLPPGVCRVTPSDRTDVALIECADRL